MNLIIQNLIPYLYEASVLALVTLGIVIIFRTSFTTNFSQGMIASVAAYVTTYATHELLNGIFGVQFNIVKTIIAFIPGLIVGFLIGVFIDKFLIRKAKYTTVLTKQMITMGIVLFISGFLPTFFAKYEQSATGMPPFPQLATKPFLINMGDSVIRIQQQHVISILVSVVVVTAVFMALKYTKWGLGVRATAANETVSGMMGINTKRITALSWGVAAALGSLGALLWALYTTVSSSMMVNLQVAGFLAAILGGFSSFIGPVVGAILIPLVTFVVYQLLGITPEIEVYRNYSKVFVYIIVLVIILIKPVGLFGKKIAKKV